MGAHENGTAGPTGPTAPLDSVKNKKDMIKYFHKSLHRDALQVTDDYQAGCWVYAEEPTVKELESLAKRFSLDKDLLADALDEEEMPRLEREGETSYIFVRFADKNEDDEFDTVPLLFVFGKEILITIAFKHLPSLDGFTSGKVDFVTTEPAKLVLQILEQIGEHYDTHISETSRQIKAIRARLRGHDIGNQDFIDFVTIEDELNEFYSSLQPMDAMLRRLLLDNYIPLFDEDRAKIEDILLNNQQSMEACTSNIKSVRNIREAYRAISSNNLNRTIKILTVATVVITIPLSITAIYSMNVSLPGQHDPNAFWIIMVVILIVVILLFVVGSRKRIF